MEPQRHQSSRKNKNEKSETSIPHGLHSGVFLPSIAPEASSAEVQGCDEGASLSAKGSTKTTAPGEEYTIGDEGRSSAGPNIVSAKERDSKSEEGSKGSDEWSANVTSFAGLTKSKSEASTHLSTWSFVMVHRLFVC